MSIDPAHDEFLADHRFATPAVTADASIEPDGAAGSMRARLAASKRLAANAIARARRTVGPPLQNSLNRAGERGAPVVDRVRAYRIPILAALAAITSVLVALLRRRGGDDVMDDSIVYDLGDWHVIGQPLRMDESA